MNKPIWDGSCEELIQATGGTLLSHPATTFHKVGTDTRLDLRGRLFVPLKGNNYNAHDFVEQAVGKGVSAVLVHEWRDQWQPLTKQITFIKVSDTLKALQDFASFWRKKHKFKVIAITGSNGKTSTKEFTATLLKSEMPTYASKGSYNNHWGVPLSILEAGPEHRVLILEMGMNKSGELWRLAHLAEPDIVTVTTVGRAHIGELGSLAKIAEAKEEIYSAVPRAIHVFNMDNEWTMRMQTRSETKQIKFSAFKADVDVHLRAQRLTLDGLDVVGTIGGVAGQTLVKVLGRQNNANLMCASALALAAGLAPELIWKHLLEIRDSAWGRNQVLHLKNGAKVLFDAYNANPDSSIALLKNLYEYEIPGRKYLVMGDMKELGEMSEMLHQEIGERAASVNFAGILYIGEFKEAFRRGLEKFHKDKDFIGIAKFDEKVVRDFANQLQANDLVALKASRGMALEKVVETWPMQTLLGHKP